MHLPKYRIQRRITISSTELSRLIANVQNAFRSGHLNLHNPVIHAINLNQRQWRSLDEILPLDPTSPPSFDITNLTTPSPHQAVDLSVSPLDLSFNRPLVPSTRDATTQTANYYDLPAICEVEATTSLNPHTPPSLGILHDGDQIESSTDESLTMTPPTTEIPHTTAGPNDEAATNLNILPSSIPTHLRPAQEKGINHVRSTGHPLLKRRRTQ
uniref:Uncharacterized protein n=1 Tax=Cacopsylla melanoneura TaxID=428564 RepID=A0A8D8MA21_9HEMI